MIQGYLHDQFGPRVVAEAADLVVDQSIAQVVVNDALLLGFRNSPQNGFDSSQAASCLVPVGGHLHDNMQVVFLEFSSEENFVQAVVICFSLPDEEVVHHLGCLSFFVSLELSLGGCGAPVFGRAAQEDRCQTVALLGLDARINQFVVVVVWFAKHTLLPVDGPETDVVKRVDVLDRVVDTFVGKMDSLR